MSNLLVNPFDSLNAEKSTGPRSPEGKAAAAQNARKHGFAGGRVVIADEDKEAYQAHLDAYFDSFQPEIRSNAMPSAAPPSPPGSTTGF